MHLNKTAGIAIVAIMAIAVVLAAFVIVYQPKTNKHDFPISIMGAFEHDEDGKWRCYANVTITNDLSENMTLKWVYGRTLNITYVDDSIESWHLESNETYNSPLISGAQFSYDLRLTEYGFDKEPKTLWVEVQISVIDFENSPATEAAIQKSS